MSHTFSAKRIKRYILRLTLALCLSVFSFCITGCSTSTLIDKIAESIHGEGTETIDAGNTGDDTAAGQTDGETGSSDGAGDAVGSSTDGTGNEAGNTAGQAGQTGSTAGQAGQTSGNVAGQATQSGTATGETPTQLDPIHDLEALSPDAETTKQWLSLGISEENLPKLEKEVQGLYYYDLLTEESDRLLYLVIYETLIQHEDTIGLPTLDEDFVTDVFQMVMNDHPEIFYVEGYSYSRFSRGDEVVKLSLSGMESMKQSEIANDQKNVDAFTRTCLSQLPEGSDYERIKYLYEYLVNCTEYVADAPNNQNICSVMMNGESVCQGYAKTMQYLMQKAGMQATLVTGTVSDGTPHAWNLVKADGEWYHVDVTWGDPSFEERQEPAATQSSGGNRSLMESKYINYDYLLVTTDVIERTHTLDDTFPIPECQTSEDNYFVKEGLYFTGYNEELLREAFQKAYGERQTFVTIKCDSYDTYQEMKAQLVDERRIFKFLRNSPQTVSFAGNDVEYSLTFAL